VTAESADEAAAVDAVATAVAAAVAAVVAAEGALDSLDDREVLAGSGLLVVEASALVSDAAVEGVDLMLDGRWVRRRDTTWTRAARALALSMVFTILIFWNLTVFLKVEVTRRRRMR